MKKITIQKMQQTIDKLPKGEKRQQIVKELLDVKLKFKI
tara:strand:- start:799 stop:915 length:117 start_codon:yes stop_codon:yes gene_type:complete